MFVGCGVNLTQRCLDPVRLKRLKPARFVSDFSVEMPWSWPTFLADRRRLKKGYAGRVGRYCTWHVFEAGRIRRTPAEGLSLNGEKSLILELAAKLHDGRAPLDLARESAFKWAVDQLVERFSTPDEAGVSQEVPPIWMIDNVSHWPSLKVMNPKVKPLFEWECFIKLLDRLRGHAQRRGALLLANVECNLWAIHPDAWRALLQVTDGLMLETGSTPIRDFNDVEQIQSAVADLDGTGTLLVVVPTYHAGPSFPNQASRTRETNVWAALLQHFPGWCDGSFSMAYSLDYETPFVVSNFNPAWKWKLNFERRSAAMVKA